MAGIAGIYCADGRPADVGELRRMVAAVEHRGPDGIGYWNAGPVALAHLQFCTTPESLEERQPLMSPGGEACLVWNGRVDNREELLAELEAAGVRVFDRTDAGLALAAYLAWGPECVQKIVGDFALAVWDARNKRLWCARDYIGVRPFYYFWDGKTFLFGPEIRALLEHPLVSLKINEGMVGEYLASELTSRDETLYADIRRLPSSSTLTIDDAGALKVESWWNPELSLLNYKTDEEYGDHFRHLMEQSIAAMTRTCFPWGVPLSGGLDSSTIAVTAQAMLKRSGSREQVSTVSMVSPGKSWDESEYIEEIVRFAGLKSEYFSPMVTSEELFRERAAWSREFPDAMNGSTITTPMLEAARGLGIRVLLTGHGGNELLESGPLPFADLIANVMRTGAIRQSLRLAREEWENWGSGRWWPVFAYRKLAAAVMPEAFSARMKKRRFERGSVLSREFLRRTNLADRIYSHPKLRTRNFSSRAQQLLFRGLLSGYEALVLELKDRDMARGGVEARLPFFDRRMAEFCLRLPESQRQRGLAAKWVLRTAMRGYLPERVRTKTFQAEFSQLAEAVLSAPWIGDRLQKPAVIKNADWLDWGRISEELLHDDRCESRSLWMTIALDLWLEHIALSSPESVLRFSETVLR